MPWFRTEGQYECISSSLPVIRSLVEAADPVDWRELDPHRSFPNVSNMTAYWQAYRWVRDYDFEFRMLLRNRTTTNARWCIDPDIFVGWHKQEIHGLATADRPTVYLHLPDRWGREVEGARMVGSPCPLVTMYLGNFLTTLDFRTGQQYGEDNAHRRSQLHQWMIMEGANLFFMLWVHTVIHGVTHRGFTDTGLRANHGRFTGFLTRLPPAVDDLVGRWGVDNLLDCTGNSPHLVQAAVERARSIEWLSIPERVVTEGGRYLRHSFRPGEFDGVPARVRMVEGNPVKLAPIQIMFWTAKTICAF